MLLQDLMRKRSTLSAAERAVADYLLVQREHLANMSARQIARNVYTSPSTVVRLCQKFGFNGYEDFREELLAELHYLTSHFTKVDPNYPFSFGERRRVTANKIGALYREIIDDTLELIDEAALDRAVELIDAAEEVYVCSAGVQADIAEGFKGEMLKIGRNVVVESYVNAAYYRAAHVDPRHSVFMVASYSGETEQLMRVVRKLHDRSVPLIAITSFGGNTLSDLADVVLPVSSHERLEGNLGQFSMNVSTMLLLDVLYASIFNENYYVNFESRIALRHGFEEWRVSHNPLLIDDEELDASLSCDNPFEEPSMSETDDA